MRHLIGVLLTFLLLTGLAAPAGAAPDEQTALPAGIIVGLLGTPHLWVAGDDGVLHWSGDTRALAGRAVDWGSRREVSLDQLTRMPRGAPWLSAGLLKDGEPIFFAKWEDSEPAPQLLQIQSIADVELFGIDGSNYGQFVLERAEWERRFGFTAQSLRRGVMAGAATAAGTTVSGEARATTVTAPVAGALARALSPAEQTAFVESALDATDARRVAKWIRPVKVQLRRSSYAPQSTLVDDMIAETGGLLNGLGISRVSTGGDIVIEFVPLPEIQALEPKALGYANYFTSRTTGALSTCTMVVAQDPEAAYGSLVQHFSPQMKTDLLGLVARHEFAHCLGLGHNQSSESFLSYNFDGLGSFYSAGARAARYNDFDRALLRTLYHSAVTAGLPEAGLRSLFGS